MDQTADGNFHIVQSRSWTTADGEGTFTIAVEVDVETNRRWISFDGSPFCLDANVMAKEALPWIEDCIRVMKQLVLPHEDGRS